MKLVVPIFIIATLVVGFYSCSEKGTRVSDSNLPKIVEAKGYVVPKDSITEPLVISFDEAKLKKFPVGKPRIVPTNLNVHPVGEPNVVLVGKPRVVTPGRDTFSLPNVVPAIDSSFIGKQPTPIPALPFTMKDAANCTMQYLDVDQGMSSSYILSILEDKRGNLWFGTNGGGVTKYDGKSFTHYTDKEGLSQKTVWSILEDKRGNLWFGTNGGGVSKYDGQRFTHYTKKEGLSNNTVWSILEDKKGNLWFGTIGGGVSKYDGQSFTHYTDKEGLGGNAVLSILEDKSGNLWIGTDGAGVSKYDGQRFIHYTDKEGLSNNAVWAILEDKSGNLWFGTYGGGVSKYDGQYFTHYTDREGLGNNSVLSILEDKTGNLWFGTNGGGVSKYDGQRFTHYTDKEGLSHNTVKSILEDKSGNLWFGTNGGGVTKYDDQRFTHYTDKEGLSSIYVRTILEDKTGNLWFGTDGGGVSKYDGQCFTHYTEKEGLSNNTIRSTLEDKRGNLWFGTDGGGVTKYEPPKNDKVATFTHYTAKEGLSNNYIMSMLEDKRGNLWFGTFGGGLTKYEPAKDGHLATFTHYTEKEGLGNNTVWSILEDKTGNLWFGTYGGGVTKYDGQRFTHYTNKGGLNNNTIRSILEDKKGNLWFGTNGGGVSKYEPAKDGKVATFTHYTNKEGLSNNVIWSINEGKTNLNKGWFWLSTEKGLNLINFKEKNSKNTLENEFTIMEFHKEDGLKAEDFFLNAVLLDRKNRIWWGSGKGLTVLDLNKFQLNEKAPQLQLDNIYLQENFVDYHNLHTDSSEFGKQLKAIKFSEVERFHNYPKNLELPYYINHLTFNFVAIDWYAQHKLKYQYKLEGLDSDWSNLTSENKADYRNIPYGKYTFKVKAIGSANKWSKTINYSFVIHPPWWHTTWFRVLMVCGLLLVLYGLYRWRTSALRKRQVELEKTVEERTAEVVHQKEIIEEKHKEITDSINYAERIQRSFLATKELLDENLQDYFVFFQPKEVVSGDFYFAAKLNNGNFAYVTADSTGHGVPGAIMSILNISSLELAIKEKLTEPSSIFNYTRNEIITRLKKDGSAEGGKDGMDASLIVLNKEKTKLTYTAANNPVWILRKNEIIELEPDKMPIGKHDKDQIPFTQNEFDLQKGDIIYTLTDGMPDQFGGLKGKKYKYTRLKEFMIEIASLPMDQQKEKLAHELTQWKGDLEQIDDVCIMGVRV